MASNVSGKEDQDPLAIKTEEVEIVSELPDEESSSYSAEGANASPSLLKCYLCSPAVLLEGKPELLEHLLAVHPVEDVYRCGECEFTALKITAFNQHLSRHDSSIRPFKCSICSLRFSTIYRRRTHEKNEHLVADGTIEKHSCTICGKGFPFESRLRHHVQRQHNDDAKVNLNGRRDVLECYLCSDGAVFDSKSAIDQHLVGHHALLDKYDCSACDYSTDKLTSFNSHLSRHDAKKRPFGCSVCPLRFVKVHGKRDHEANQHGIKNGRMKVKPFRERQKNVSCPDCGKKFTFQCNLKRHVMAVHPAETTSQGPSVCTKCYLCIPNGSFDNRDALLEHLKNLHPVQSEYSCKECDYSATQTVTYNNHLSGHDAILRPYKCSSCTERFKTRDGKSRHEAATHGVENPSEHSCSDCGKKFSFKSRLLLHQRAARHGPEANVEHQKSDTNEQETKKNACSICGKTFAKNSGLIEHTLFVHRKKTASNHVPNQLQCYLCSSAKTVLQSRRGLKAHLRAQHPTLAAYECEQCSFTTRVKTDFNLHHSEHYSNKLEEPTKTSSAVEVKTEAQNANVTTDRSEIHVVDPNSSVPEHFIITIKSEDGIKTEDGDMETDSSVPERRNCELKPETCCETVSSEPVKAEIKTEAREGGTECSIPQHCYFNDYEVKVETDVG